MDSSDFAGPQNRQVKSLEVRQGPDGFLYLLTDEDDGALLRIEPSV